ncbi:outer membrane protein transport protein [Myxococcota bacterium]|nr:outer membrane protein transport protein [Myxococcota bacterium]MBU1896547.1 outer membrane protein transport protein [Myxococcota bacterium]
MSPARLCLTLLSALCPLAAHAVDPAQTPALLLLNYSRIPLGTRAAVEGGAFHARADDPSAAWYNPAGLTYAVQDTFSANVSVYEATWIAVNAGGKEEGAMSITDFPPFIGNASVLVQAQGRTIWAWGFSIAKPINWSQSLNYHDHAVDEEGWVSDYIGTYALELTTLAPGLSVGWAPSERLRFGASARLYLTHLMIQDSAFERDVLEADSAIDTLLYTSNLSGTSYGLRVALAAQHQLTSRLRLGLQIRSPTWHLYSKAQHTEQFMWAGNDFYEDGFQRDEAVDFDVRLPTEIDVGVAWVSPRLQLEGDLRIHLPVSKYFVANPHATGEVLEYDEAEGALRWASFEEEEERFTTSGALVINAALGGRLQLSEKAALHFGAFTDLSPVVEGGGEEEIFDDLDLFGGTLGLSLKGAHAETTLGLLISLGQLKDWTLDVEADETLTGTVTVTSVALILGGSYWY